MSFWEINKKVLQQHYSGLLEEISGSDDLSLSDISIEPTPSGEPSCLVKGICIHSRHDPVREGQRLAKYVSSGSGSVVILGFGLGYAAQAAAESGKPVIIVEKYKSLLRKALELRDLSGLLTQKNIMFIPGGSGDAITSALDMAEKLTPQNETGKKPPAVIRNKALTDLDKEWYAAVEDKIRAWSMRDEVNAATLKRFGRRWVRNLSHNIAAIRDCPGINRLAGIAAADANAACSEPLPVFLAAAGPSLDKAAPLLRDIHKRCIVVAVDTSLRFFINNGVQPDFVLVADPQFWNSRHLDQVTGSRLQVAGCRDYQNTCSSMWSYSQTGMTLIAEAAVYPSVLRLPFKRIFLCGSIYPLGEFIESRVDPKGRLGAGGSVATTAWDFARTLLTISNPLPAPHSPFSINTIWIAGLDLAFPGLKTHFRGARFEELAGSQSCRFNPVETWVFHALRDGFPFKAPCASGGQVLTDRRLSLYAAWFENNFLSHSNIKNFALFQNGLAIAGLHAADTEKFLALPNRRAEIDRRLEDTFSKIEADFHSPEEMRQREERYEKAVSSLARGLENIKSAAESGEAIAEKALKYKPDIEKHGKILNDLDKIMRRIKESDVKEVAGFLFPPSDDRENNGSDAADDPFRAYLESSYRFFSSLAEAVRNVNVFYHEPH